MNKSSIIRKLGAILQTKKATKEEVKEAYENSGLMFIGARGGGKVLMANAMKEEAIKRGEKIVVVRRGRYEVQDQQHKKCQ